MQGISDEVLSRKCHKNNAEVVIYDNIKDQDIISAQREPSDEIDNQVICETNTKDGQNVTDGIREKLLKIPHPSDGTCIHEESNQRKIESKLSV